MASPLSLVIEDDAGKQIVIPFAKDVLTVGRKEGNSIRLTDRNVSRFHAKLLRENGHVVVEDLQSFNGVKINGDRIQGRVSANPGDVIEIGDYHLELRSAVQATPKSAVIGHGPTHSDDDDFAGDTQRWTAPASMDRPSLTGAATLEEAAEDTARMVPPSTQRAGGGFADGEGETERISMDQLQAMASRGSQNLPPPAILPPAHSYPPPGRSVSDDEVTARQAGPSHLHEPTVDMALARSATPAPIAMPPLAQAPVPIAPPARRAPVNDDETAQLRPAPGPAPSDDLTQPRLVVLNTVFAGSTFPLRAMEAVIGRTDDNDIVIEHKSVSRNHAKIVREGDRVRILDLKSANGVLVNDAEVDQVTLRSGDVIELGRVRLRFVPIGERFVVPPDEIERARVADASGDLGDTSSPAAATGRIARASSDPPAPARSPVALYAGLAVLVVVVIIAAVFVFRGGAAPTPGPAVPTTTSDAPPVATPPTETTPPPPEAPANAVPTAAPPATVVAASVVPAAVVPPEVPAPPRAPARVEAPAPVEAAPATPKATPAPAGPTTASKEPRAKMAPAVVKQKLDDATHAVLTSQPEKALAILLEVKRAQPDNPTLLRQLGTVYKVLRQRDNARAAYDRYLELYPDAVDATTVRASRDRL